MSVLDDNKKFLSGILVEVFEDENFDFETLFATTSFGLWKSTFINPNFGNFNGYSIPEPLIKDIITYPFAITGKSFSITNIDGKAAKTNFFITQALKGQQDYVPIIDITNSHVSGSKPEIFMSGVSFPGKIFRRFEITGENVSNFSNEKLLIISGEDWSNSQIQVSGYDTNLNYTYIDSEYSGYSNEVTARYKFLYNDSSNSSIKNFFSFDPPTKLEDDSSFKYRIARKSDPFGTFSNAEIDNNGKVLIDLEKYKDEASESLTGAINYNFSQFDKINLSSLEISEIHNENNEGKVLLKKIKNDESITGLKMDRGEDAVRIFLLSNAENHTGIYRLNFTTKISKNADPITKIGYVMSGYQLGNLGNVGNVGNAGNINIGLEVYSTVIEDGNAYDYKNFLTEAEIASQLKEQIKKYPEERSLSDSISDSISDLFSDEDSKKEAIDSAELANYTSNLEKNSKPYLIKYFLQNFPLPKKTISKDYYSNYLNSGESYIVTPLEGYFSDVLVNCGGAYPYLGKAALYTLEEGEAPQIKSVNQTTNGLQIGVVDFCKGDSATKWTNQNDEDPKLYENGGVTQIPENGIIKKINYKSKESWEKAINYFYTKNYIASYTVDPTVAKADGTIVCGFFKQILSKIQEAVPNARVFVEREIYTEPYNENQVSEFNREFNSKHKLFNGENLNINEDDKLYCIQSYGGGLNNSNVFFPAQRHSEKLTFNNFYAHTNFVEQYVLEENESIGVLTLKKGIEIPKGGCFRIEYAIGTNNVFNYNNYSSSIVWEGSFGSQIIINPYPDEANYAYHLYTYSNYTNELVLAKSNVKNNDYHNSINQSGIVLKFLKQNFETQFFKKTFNDEPQLRKALPLTLKNENLSVIQPSHIRVNIQIYTYERSSAESSNYWHTFSKDFFNDNQYGDVNSQDLLRPRFAEEDSLETAKSRSIFYDFPNGPFTSKNHEGSPININDSLNLVDDILKNEIIVTEEGSKSKAFRSYESHCILDFVEENAFVKQKSPNHKGLDFSNTKRTKITKILYNFYAKNLVIIGDAATPYSADFNDGWEYELQYRKIIEDPNWKKINKSDTFTKNEISCKFSVINPEYLSFTDDYVHLLSMVAFEVNLPLYLDDADFEFKIVKYNKLSIQSSSEIDVIKKVNFIPIQVSWSENSTCSRFNIYQKDTGNSLALLGSENVRKTSSYVVPDVRQSYVNMGVANFGSPNYSGYYDIVVSGVVDSVVENQTSVSNEYGFQVGDTNSNLTIKKVNNSNANNTFISITGATYSPMLNFNNPESKNSNFEINQNYSGYYFVTNSATSILKGITGQGFEAYVANTGSTTCQVSTTNLLSNNVAIINGTPSITPVTLQNLPSDAFLDLGNILDGEVVYLKSNTTIVNSDSVGREFYLINDSISQVAISYSNITPAPTLEAQKTYKINATSSTFNITETLPNVEIQDDYIYSNKGLTNFNHSDLTLSSSCVNVPIYNVSQNSLIVNNSLTLNPNSFNFVSWGGSNNEPTQSEKSYFDNIKIHLKGNESESPYARLLKDDTEIVIVDDFPQNTIRTYHFLKDQSITRELNVKIKIINNLFETLSEVFVPNKRPDFKLTVTRNKANIRIEIDYPSLNANFNLTNEREQLITLSSSESQVINLNNVEDFLHQNSLVYFINQSFGEAQFMRNSKELGILSQNQIARLVLKQDDVSVQILENARHHFKFDIPDASLSGPINILNLDFCGAAINFPSANSISNESSTLLICKNRLLPNRINESNISPYDGSLFLNGIGDLSFDSIFLDVYKNEGSASLTVRKTTSFELGVIPNEVVLNSNVFNYFYISDENLSNFTLRDFYNRKVNYAGKIFFPDKRTVTVRSFDEKNIIPNLKSTSLSFNYNPDEYVNGRLIVKEESDEIILSYQSEGGSTAISFTTTLLTNQICANFAYDTINVIVAGASKTLKKNRLIYNGTIYPIYNKDEFFIVGYNYYYKITELTDVDSIIIPDSLGQNITIRNYSSKSYGVKNLSNSFSNLTILPNKEITLQYSSAWNQIYNGNFRSEHDIEFNSVGVIQFSNQSSEISSTNPLSSLFVDGEDYSENFIPNGLNSISAVEGELGYKFIDIDSAPSASAEEKTMFCFGRRSKIENSSVSKFYFINDFYLYAEFNQSIVRKGEIWIGEAGAEVAFNPLTIIKRQHVDLSKHFTNYTFDSSRNVIFIPIASHLITYYLPNLSQSVTQDEETLGSKLNGKKIVFINLVKNSALAPNQVINYSNSNAVENLIDINSLLVYSASATTWTKQTSSLPVVTAAYPTLTGVKGITNLSDSTTANGDEMVYLSNFNKFYVGIDSFENQEYGGFYIYNSRRDPITIFEINGDNSVVLEKAFEFIKVERNLEKWLMVNIAINSPLSFISTSDENVLNQKFNAGTVIKLASSAAMELHLYIDENNSKLIELESECVLNLEDLKTYNLNDKLFIFKSLNSPGNEDDAFYNLKLVNQALLTDGEKFYIHNASQSVLKIFYDEDEFLLLPSLRTLEISKNEFSFMEFHYKGFFYIRPEPVNYLLKSKIHVLIDDLPYYYENKKFDFQSVSISLPIDNEFLSQIFTYNLSNTQNSILKNPKALKSESLKIRSRILIDSNRGVSSSLVRQFSIKIISAGHYIINNNNKDIKIGPNISEDIFLVNNCAQDISVYLNETTTKPSILFRNTVLVINNGQIRYLKKAKQRDEFYCVFNPKTMAFIKNAPVRLDPNGVRAEKVAPEYGARYIAPVYLDPSLLFPTPSYVKLLSKTKENTLINLSTRDYYNGTDIPTNSPDDILAYEVGIGHETIYKFLFFDPSKFTYTLPGIENGAEYVVEVDIDLFNNLNTIHKLNESNLKEDPYVIYNGKIYYSEETFTGEKINNYEVKYPNYVKVAKIIKNLEKTFNNVEISNEVIDPEILENLPVETASEESLFKEVVIEKLRETLDKDLNIAEFWSPINKSPFWQDSNFEKDIYKITKVSSSDVKTISRLDNAGVTQSVTFVKCEMKKENLKEIVRQDFEVFYSALQFKHPVSDFNDLSIGVMGNMSPRQQDSFLVDLEASHKRDGDPYFLEPIAEMNLTNFGIDYLGSIFKKGESVDISIALEKLKPMPAIEFENFSNSSIIKLLNGEEG